MYHLRRGFLLEWAKNLQEDGNRGVVCYSVLLEAAVFASSSPLCLLHGTFLPLMAFPMCSDPLWAAEVWDVVSESQHEQVINQAYWQHRRKHVGVRAHCVPGSLWWRTEWTSWGMGGRLCNIRRGRCPPFPLGGSDWLVWIIPQAGREPRPST